MRPFVSCIVLAAGIGARFKSPVPKPLLEINRRPIIIHCLQVLSLNASVREIILVVNSRNRKAIQDTVSKYRINKVKGAVLGGRERKDSVFCGLKAASKEADLVLIHDSARPFINKKLVSLVIDKALKSKAAISAVPVKATIKVCSGSQAKGLKVVRTLKRDSLWEVQTPQVFEKNLLKEAYRKFRHSRVTDDAMLVEKLRKPVSVVMGSYDNIKITTPEDLPLAEAIAKVKGL